MKNHEKVLSSSSAVVAGTSIEAWTIATEDTKLTVGANKDGQLVVCELSNPAAGWNWTAEPSVFDLVAKAGVDGVDRPLRWQFKGGTLEENDGQQLRLRFACAEPALELESVWRARPGRGPVRHAMRIANRSGQPVTLHEQPTVHLALAGRPEKGALTLWTFHTDGHRPDAKGVYRDEVTPSFRREVLTLPDKQYQFIPYAVFDAGGKHGVYVGVEWTSCRIAVSAPDGDGPGRARVRGGEFDGFRIEVAAGETFEVPPGFIGAYAGDVDDAGNSLRRHLFHHGMPEIVRRDPTYPKVQWNAFYATGDRPGNWNSVEAKYYPLVDEMARLGFEEVMLDVGWWQGETRAEEPVAETRSIGHRACARPRTMPTPGAFVSASTGPRVKTCPPPKGASDGSGTSSVSSRSTRATSGDRTTPADPWLKRVTHQSRGSTRCSINCTGKCPASSGRTVVAAERSRTSAPCSAA